MKFSWKANWEILLVLVIIAVGIVITTIAAIKNRDKHLVVSPADDSDINQFQLGRDPQTGGGQLSSSNINGDVSSNLHINDDGGGASFQNSGSMRAGADGNADQLNHAANNDQQTHNLNPHLNSHNTLHHPHLTSNHLRRPAAQLHSMGPGFQDSKQISSNSNRAQLNASPAMVSGAKFDDVHDIHSPLMMHNSNGESGHNGGAGFDSPLGTEPTPMQMRLNQMNNRQPHRYREPLDHERSYSSNGNQLAGAYGGGKLQHQHMINNNNEMNEPASASTTNLSGSPNNNDHDLNLDDIHTTRSSLNGQSGSGNGNNNYHQFGAGPNPIGNANLDNHPPPPIDISDHQVILLKQANPNQLMAGGKTSSPPGGGGGIDGDIDSNDLIHPHFGRPAHHHQQNNHINSNSTTPTSQQQLNSALMTNLLASMPPLVGQENNSQLQNNNPDGASFHHQHQQLNAPINQQQQNFRGPFSGSLPISMLINDILKLARPASSSSASAPPTGSSGEHQQQYNSHRGTNSQQQSTGSPLGGGILQQLKSLPTPFLNLLQSLSSSSSTTGTTSTNQHNQNLNNQFAQSPQDQALMNQFMMANNDASESNQYYHKLLPSDIDAILARSMRSATGQPPLPAFPAPKGFSEKRWTQGESPDVYQSPFNANADLVANNVAGFVRLYPKDESSSATNMNHETAPQISQSGTGNGASAAGASTTPNAATPNLGLGANARAMPATTATTVSQQGNQQQQQSQQQQQHYQQPQWFQQQQHPIATVGENGNVQVTLIESKPNNNNNQPTIYQNNFAQQNVQTSNNNNMQQQQQIALGLAGPQPISTMNQRYQPQQTRPVALGAPIQYQQQQQQQHQQYQAQHPMAMVVDATKQKPTITVAPDHQFNQQQTNRAQQLSTGNGIQQQQNHHQIQLQNNIESANGPQSMALVADKQTTRTKRSLDSRLYEGAGSGGGGANDVTNNIDDHEEYRRRRDRSDSQADPVSTRLAREEQRAANEVTNNADGNDSDEDDDSDDPPMSVLSIDGQPMNVRDGMQLRKSHRRSHYRTYIPEEFQDHQKLIINQGNRKDHNDNDKHRTATATAKQQQQQPREGVQMEAASSGLMSKLLLGAGSSNDELEDELDDDDESASEKRKEEIEDAEFGIVTNKAAAASARRRRKNNNNRKRQEDQLMNGLMNGGGKHGKASGSKSSKNKLLQTTNGGNSINQQAAYPLLQSSLRPETGGLNNDNNQQQHQQTSRSGQHEPSAADKLMHQNNPTGEADDASPTYARRQQQRSDVEFYGHPGEETRVLKYGILGSGNYEIVNGGVYVENDELTAAVNSVANYVRKPGGTAGNPNVASQTALALALPRLLSGKGLRVGSATSDAGSGPNKDDILSSGGLLRNQHQLNHLNNHNSADGLSLSGNGDNELGPVHGGAGNRILDQAFIPLAAGRRLNAAGLLRGASVLAESEPALHDNQHHHHQHHNLADGTTSTETGKHGDASPLLDLIYDTHNSFDSNLLTQLGSSTRTVQHHDNDDGDTIKSNHLSAKQIDGSTGNRKLKQYKSHKKQLQDDTNDVTSTVENDEVDGPRKTLTAKIGNAKVSSKLDKSVNDNDEINYEGGNSDRGNQATIRHQNDQFNSYVISPSKKVTIFSDRDLDSAPSDTEKSWLIPPNEILEVDNIANKPYESSRMETTKTRQGHHDHHQPYRSSAILAS